MARKIYHYTDIAGMSANEGPDIEHPCFYAHDGSTCTLLRVHGLPTIVSEDEAIERSARVMDMVSSSLRTKGRALTVTYERSYNIADEVDELIVPLSEAALRKGLSMQAAVNEVENVLLQNVVQERILIAVWTFRDAAEPASFKQDKTVRASTTGRLIRSRSVQDPNGPYESLQANHRGFVTQIKAAMAGQGFIVDTLGPNNGGRDDLTEVRRSILYHETPRNWAPKEAGPVRYPRAKNKSSADVSTLFADTIDRQIMTSAASSSNDLRRITLGGRNYAVLQMTGFPNRMISFRSLLRNIDGSTTRLDPMPFRIAFHMEGGAKVNGLAQTLATIGSLFSNANRQIRNAFDGIANEMKNDAQTYAYTRIYATTWTEPHEDSALLDERRSRLTRALNSWQSPTITDSAPDPMRLLAETCPGMVAVARTGNQFIAPTHELGYAMPFHSDAPIERQGETIYTTMDGKPMPFKAHSPMQDSWCGLVFASPGSGKSMLMNSMNMDFACYNPSAQLPYMGILDVGDSSAGFIESLYSALPLERKNEVAFISMRNEQGARQYTVNPFDIGLGRRRPLQREKTFAMNFLLAMCSEMEGREGISAVIEVIVTQLYERFSDLSISSGQKIYQVDKDPLLDGMLKSHNIPVHDNLSWWQVADKFMLAGRPDLAERAHRYALPQLSDAISLLATEEIRRAHGAELCQSVLTQISSGINAFPAFSGETQLDIGSARVVSLDLKHVVNMTPTTDTDRRNNLLFFMMSRELFIKKISGDDKEIPMMHLPEGEAGQAYREYWRKRVSDIAQTRKRFCFDEFHITGSSPIMASQIDQDVRQGRKWGLEVILVSQRLQDFERYTDFAANLFVLRVATRTEQEVLRSVFKAEPAVTDLAMQYCTGPIPGIGATILIRRSFKGQTSWLFANNRLGPVRVWSLTTTLEDRSLRKAMAEITGDLSTALEILASRFPTGTAKTYWDRVSANYPSGTDIATEIAQALLAEHTP